MDTGPNGGVVRWQTTKGTRTNHRGLPDGRLIVRWKCFSALIVISLLRPVCGSAQSQPAQPATPVPQSAPAPAPAMPIHVAGNVQRAKLSHTVQPVYPPIAVAAGIQGTVSLHVIIARDGSVAQVQFISGPPLLVYSAIEAVKQWRYQPTLVDGRPVEVDTTVDVSFVIANGHPPASPTAHGGAVSPHPENAPASGVAVVYLNATKPPIDPQLRADLLRLFALTNVMQTIQGNVQVMARIMRPHIVRTLPDTLHREQIADETAQKLAALMTSQEFEDRLVAVYAKYFNDKQVRALIEIFQTPAWQYYRSVQGRLSEGLRQAGAGFEREHFMTIYAGLCSEHPELQGKAAFCPATPAEAPAATGPEPTEPATTGSAATGPAATK